MDRAKIINAFLTRKHTHFSLADGRDKAGVIASLEHEDGSGYSFLIRLEGESHAFYLRANAPQKASIIRVWEVNGEVDFAEQIRIGTDDIEANLQWLDNYLCKPVQVDQMYPDPHTKGKSGEKVLIYVERY